MRASESVRAVVERWRARVATSRLEPAVTLATNTLNDARRDRVTGLAAEVTFYALLAVPPLMLVVLGGLGFVAQIGGADTTENLRDALISGAETFLADSTIEETVEPTVDSLLAGGRADIMSLGAVLALWSTSRATKVVMVAMTIAYDLPLRRTVWQRRGLALALTAGGVMTVVLVIPLLVLGPRAVTSLGRSAGMGGAAEPFARIVHWPVIALLGLLLLTWLYHLAPPWKTPWRRDLPGAVLALTAWVVGALVVRAYTGWTIESDTTYGPFASPIVILLWIYISALAVLLGAELNAEIEKLWPTGPRVSQDEPASTHAED